MSSAEVNAAHVLDFVFLELLSHHRISAYLTARFIFASGRLYSHTSKSLKNHLNLSRGERCSKRRFSAFHLVGYQLKVLTIYSDNKSVCGTQYILAI